MTAPVTSEHRGWRGFIPWFRTHPYLGSAHVVVSALVVFVATFRLGVADAAPDEFTYHTCASEYLKGVFTCNQEHPPFVKELLAIGIVVGNRSLLDARLVTACIACLTALFCYLFVSDVTDRAGGLIAGGLWGLLPQAGIEGSRTLEVIRIDRFALLDPYVACFFAATLFAGWRWISRGGSSWALLTGVFCAAVTVSKAPGVAIAIAVFLFVLVARRRRHGVVSELILALLGAGVLFFAVYAPLGLHDSIVQISYMLHFKFNRIVLVDGHLYQRTPWWADISFAIFGLSRPVAIVLGASSLLAFARYPKAASLALISALALLLFVAIGVHLSSPNYWVEWEPGVITAAAIGVRSLFSPPAFIHPTVAMPALVAAGIILAAGSISTIDAVINVAPGPYAIASESIHCTATCLVEYAGYDDIPISYLPSTMHLLLGPPEGRVRVRHHPQYVLIDPALLQIHPRWRAEVSHFVANARRFGYLRVASPGPIEIWRRLHPARS